MIPKHTIDIRAFQKHFNALVSVATLTAPPPWDPGSLYLLWGSLAAARVWTSSTAELKSLMFSEEYSAEGLLYWLVTTLEPKPANGSALRLWVEPMCLTSCREIAPGRLLASGQAWRQ